MMTMGSLISVIYDFYIVVIYVNTSRLSQMESSVLISKTSTQMMIVSG